MGTRQTYKELEQVHERRTIPYGSSDPAEVWQEVVEKDGERIRDLCKTMMEVCAERIPPWIFNMLAELFYAAIYQTWGKFIHESDYISDRIGVVSRAQMAFLQRQYTLVHAFCSTVTTWDEENQEMVCMRSLDWPASDEIAKCTRIFELRDNNHEKVAEVAGIAGMIGMLTGVRKGFSVALNYAPWHLSARFYSDPTFLIRELLQNTAINNFDEALGAVKSWRVGAPCFITICGESKGQAAVIEIGTGDDKHLREARDDGLLAQTNHYDLRSPFAWHNCRFYDREMSPDEWYLSELMKNSKKRRELIEEALEPSRQTSEALEQRLRDIFSTPPVMNQETAQWVVMRPKRGTMQVWSSGGVPGGEQKQAS